MTLRSPHNWLLGSAGFVSRILSPLGSFANSTLKVLLGVVRTKLFDGSSVALEVIGRPFQHSDNQIHIQSRVCNHDIVSEWVVWDGPLPECPFGQKASDYLAQPAGLPAAFAWDASFLPHAFEEDVSPRARFKSIVDLWCEVYGGELEVGEVSWKQ